MWLTFNISLGGAFDMFFLQPLYEAMGFPPLEESDYPECGVSGLNERCSKEGMLFITSRQL